MAKSQQRTDGMIKQILARLSSEKGPLRTVMVNILDICCTANCRAITTRCVVISTIELVQNQRSTISTDILNASKLGMWHDVAGRVSGIRGENNRGTSDDLFCNFIRMNMIMVIRR